MTSRYHSLLLRILAPLVAEWGYEEVRRALTEVSEVTSAARSELALAEPLRREASANRESRRSKRPTAVDYVAKLDSADREDMNLLEIASRFDRRDFLPSMGDVREFLSMQGQEPTQMKDRSDAFRRILPVLQRLPRERLEHLANSASYSGPARLGPLSDAIRATGDALRRSENATGPKQNS